LIRYIQMCGRVLRPAPGKAYALILDHSGTVRRLGFPTDDLPLELDDGKPKKASEVKPKERLPKVCAACGYVPQKPSSKCPSCGFEAKRQSEVETEEGSLKKVKRTDNKESKQATYSALVGYFEFKRSQGKTWREGWVATKYRAIYGVWPRSMEWIPGKMTAEVQNKINESNQAYANTKRRIQCPKCQSTDFERRPGVGPHAAGAQCMSCRTFWWIGKSHVA
jgi:DNA repair protein RadD